MLIDEENVFHEWEYATGRLMEEILNPDLVDKYNRVKFFEKARKQFRKRLSICPSY